MLFLLAILQVTVMPHLTVAHVQPDLILAVTVCWALFRGPTEGAVLGFLGGIALDLFSGAPFGMHTFVMTGVGAVAGFAAALIPREQWALLPGTVLACTVFQQAACVWLLQARGWPLEWSQVLVSTVIPAALLNLLLSVLLYPPVGAVHRWTGPEELGW